MIKCVILANYWTVYYMFKGVNGFSFDPFDREELYYLMKNTIEGKNDLKARGEASMDIIKDYTPEKAAKVIKETIEFVLNGAT